VSGGTSARELTLELAGALAEQVRRLYLGSRGRSTADSGTYKATRRKGELRLQYTFVDVTPSQIDPAD
jgi:hypothetical protein